MLYDKTIDELDGDSGPKLAGETFDESSVGSLSHLSVSPPCWSSNEQRIAESLPQNISLKVETQSQLYHHVKHLDLQLPDQESRSVQAIDKAPCEVGVIGATKSQCNPSQSGQDGSCGKDTEGQVKPVFLVNNPSTLLNPSLPSYNHSMAYAQNAYVYADTYIGGIFTPYGPQAFAHLGGSAPARIPLPLELAEDEPIYVNPKQYGILGGGNIVQSSRHKTNSLKIERVRGSGGRFLSKKKLQQSDVNCTNGKNSRTELKAEYKGSSTSCSDISSASHHNGNFHLPEHRFSDVPPVVGSMCDGTRHGTSVSSEKGQRDRQLILGFIFHACCVKNVIFSMFCVDAICRNIGSPTYLLVWAVCAMEQDTVLQLSSEKGQRRPATHPWLYLSCMLC
ncbi:Nuclear transcription factor Y subunit A-3, putative isoform 4 [Hibiscus syriacus]|uniref:Nuclear transcription factor Y subunit A-3, putative isoform 4 n=1 Tax=Hibiscus syriacus TaxID=106335 RepID=A0A6A3B526_HIBSY|nr:Nuclear transcription factor Y subunit A-3, putative isoform 4 [Hibiscus syriacus]